MAAEALTSELPDGEQQYPELEDDDWDGELEAYGEIESTWPTGDHDDGLSNQSTVTLSSSTSNPKRSRDDVEAGDGEEAEHLQNGSPGMFRCFVTACSETEKSYTYRVETATNSLTISYRSPF